MQMIQWTMSYEEVSIYRKREEVQIFIKKKLFESIH